MKWLGERWTIIKNAAGIRWEIAGLLVALFIGRIDWLYKLYLQITNQPSKEDQMIFGFPSWILGVTVFLGFLTYWLLEYSVKLRSQIKSFTEPKVKMHEPFYWTTPKDAQGKADRTYRLRIENQSCQLIENCQVKLIDMFNKDHLPTKESGRPFKLSVENPPDVLNASFSQSFDLRPLESIEVDIVKFNETIPSPHIRMCYATLRGLDINVYRDVPVTSCPHVLTISAVANNTIPINRKFRFYIDENGILKFEAVQ